MPTVELSTGISTFYQVEGTGDVLLLIMGTGADHSTWDAQVECYSKHFKVISYDTVSYTHLTLPTKA